MDVLKDVGRELFKMFLGDVRLFASVMALIALVAALIEVEWLAPTGAGLILLGGTLAMLVGLSATEARRRRAASSD